MNTMLYRYPGPHDIHGDKFDYAIVADEDIERALDGGWFLTTPEAKRAFESAMIDPESVRAKPEPIAENAPPTRAELLQKAEELNLNVDKRWRDQRLAAEIESALKA